MNEHKFCFIICADEDIELEECLWYIEKLDVPEGYETETIVIRDVVSMEDGYNEGMAQSDARYKIYLYSDVFVVKRDMLSELLVAFEEPSIGMVGIVGKKEMDSSEANKKVWDAGAVESCNVIDAHVYDWSCGEEKKWIDVAEIDKMFMATQYDLPWKEEKYRIVVPQIDEKEKCWVFHDEGQRELGLENPDEEIKEKQIVRAFENGDFEGTVSLIQELGLENLNHQMAYIVLFLKVRAEELKIIGETNYPDASRMQDFIREYDEIKFLVRRMYFGYAEGVWEELCRRVCAGQCTMKMIWQVTQICIADRNTLWWDIFAKYREEIRVLIRKGEILMAERFLLQMDEVWRGKEGNILTTLARIYHREVEKGETSTVFDIFREPAELTDYYVRLKYYMRRLEFGLPEEYWQEVYDYCVETRTSDYLIFEILVHNIFYKEEFCRNLSRLFAGREGVNSVRAGIYAQLAESNAKR